MSAKRPARDWFAVGAGIRGVVVLALTAVDSLISALIGIPPIRWCARKGAAVIRDSYRLGRFGPPSESTEVEPLVVDGELVDKEAGR